MHLLSFTRMDCIALDMFSYTYFGTSSCLLKEEVQFSWPYNNFYMNCEEIRDVQKQTLLKYNKRLPPFIRIPTTSE